MRISYTDGAEVESRIAQLLIEGKDLSSSSLLASEFYHEWPVRYHLSPERSNLFRHFDFEGLDVLELGAGMGGASRFPAENAKSFTAVEGTEARMDALKQRLRDLRNWQGVVSSIEEYRTEKRFDVVCIVGVLEYAELYMNPGEGESAYSAMLKKAVSLLKPGGLVAVAIENSHGFKYWAGAEEDHTGQLFDGICGYPETISPRTFSRNRLKQFLGEAGLNHIEEFFPFPDYKLPHAVLSKKFVERYPELAADIAVDALNREAEADGRYFPLSLAIPSAVQTGLLPDLANSFLFVGGKEPHSFIRDRFLSRMLRDNEYAWHYSIRRKRPIRTVFRMDPLYRRAPYVEKQPFHRYSPRKEPQSDYAVWRHVEPTPALLEPKVSHYLRSTAYFQGREAFREALLHFVKWSFKRWRFEEGYLRPAAFDAVPQNAVITAKGYELFDLEWELVAPMNKSWFLLRTIFTMRDAVGLLPVEERMTPEALYEACCLALGVTPQLEEDIRREATVQSDVFRRVNSEDSYNMIRSAMGRLAPPLPRNPRTEGALRRQAGSELADVVRDLQVENDALKSELQRTSVKLALKWDARLRKAKPVYSMLRRLGGKGS